MNRLYDRIFSPEENYFNLPVSVRLPNEDALHSSKRREELSGPLIIYNIRDLEKEDALP